MDDQNRNSASADGGQQGKYNYNNQASELKLVRDYLTVNNATATMVATALNIYRPNLTRYKAMLQEAGALIVTHNDYCKETGCKADYLSCDPKKVKGAIDGKE